MSNAIFDDAGFDPSLQDALIKLRKGAAASFNAKKTAQILALFPGWTISQTVKLKPSTEIRELGKKVCSLDFRASIHARAMQGTTLHERSFYDKDEAAQIHAALAKLVVSELPDVAKAKADDFIVMNLTAITEESSEDRTAPYYCWTFDLFRKVKVTEITAPDGQTFDVCSLIQVLGYGGAATTFGDFFKWAFANTTLEADVNAKLGTEKHIPAGERPRVPVGGQTLGTCAICSREQVVRNGVMVNHGYQRPGVGYILGECFGCGHDPIEVSPNACIAYIPYLENAKTGFETRLVALQTGKITQFRQIKRNWRTNQNETIVIAVGDKLFDSILASEIENEKQQIVHVTKDIEIMHARINNWTVGTLRHNAG